jgi:hypothetical protein
MEFSVSINYNITGFIQDLLKKRFPADRLKQQVYESGDKLNFACPYCGDSKSDSKKKRGNLYPDRGFYKCYNDGCGVKADLTKFISKFSLKYSLGVPDLKSKEVKWEPQTTKKKRGSLIELLISRNASDHLLRIDYLIDRFSLTSCNEVDPDSQVGQFIKKRNLQDTPAFNGCSYFDSRDDKVYLFNIDLRSGKVLGFAIRRLAEDLIGPKYLIKNYSELKKNGLIRGIGDDVLSDIDTINNYFNVLNVDFSKPIMVTEGQIDAMFLNNSIATTGISKSRLLLENLLSKSNTLILFDSDEAGKKQSIELIKRGYRVFLWNKALAEVRKEYSADYRNVRLIKDVNDLFTFMKSHDSELDFQQFNDFILSNFSESPLDLIYV